MGVGTTRGRIIAAADRLFYERGFEHTSFSDIAEAVQISRGNFYHHFKTKDDILTAVIGARLTRTAAMLDDWEIAGSGPGERIGSFVDMWMGNRADIVRHGCPVGTLCSELAKLGHPSREEANQLLTLFRTWLRRQFELAGRERDADALAMHLLARSQGVATLANAFGDEQFIEQEVQQMHQWLRSQSRSAPTDEEETDVRRAAQVRRQREPGR
jgi:TetR/AcrR family transcriptional repressor of nem operon